MFIEGDLQWFERSPSINSEKTSLNFSPSFPLHKPPIDLQHHDHHLDMQHHDHHLDLQHLGHHLHLKVPSLGKLGDHVLVLVYQGISTLLPDTDDLAVWAAVGVGDDGLGIPEDT